MKQLVILPLFILGISVLNAQSFEKQTNDIARKIDSITITEKNNLKEEIKKIDEKLKKKTIDYSEAEKEKKRLADFYAERIENGVNFEKQKLDALISNRVESHIAGKVNDTINDKNNSTVFTVKINKNEEKKERRTTGQLVFAFGINTLLSKDSEIGDNLKTFGSKFWEYGYTWNTRLSNDSNLTHIKYGVSLLYNNYKPTNNQVFIKKENETILSNSDIEYSRNRFRNFYINIPIHFEFDFTPMKYSNSGEKLHRSHKGLRVGVGGYTGFLVNTAYFMKYNEDGKKISSKTIDNYNVNKINYGISTYIGYKQISLYAKYDLQPIFKHNPMKDNNLSIGLRWDFN